MKERPTIVDIANELGISNTTVSRALRNDRRISEATRKRVADQAREMSYVPNAIARGLTRRETGTVGIVLPEMSVGLHFARLVSAIEGALLRLGYVTYICCTGGSLEAEAEALHMLQQKQVDGIILTPVEGARSNSQLVRNLVTAHVPVVFADRYIPGVNLPCVASDNRDGAFAATEHLLQLGHRHIAFIQVETESSSLTERFYGYCQALRSYEAPLLEHLHPICKPEESAVRHAVREMLSLSQPPTAIFAPNEGILVDTLFELKAQDIEVPDQLSLVAFDEPNRAVGLFCRVTHLRQPIDRLGEQCVQVLARLMNGAVSKEDSAAQVLLKPSLHVLESTAPLATRWEAAL